jgi:hypothetical protein
MYLDHITSGGKHLSTEQKTQELYSVASKKGIRTK